MTKLFQVALARRLVIALSLLSGLLGGPALADDTAASYSLAVGGDANFALQENPSTGYRWHLDPAASNNLSAIDISDAGFTDAGGKPLIGAPGQRHFRITARAPGTAVAVFDYMRDWEKLEPVHRHTVTVEVTAR
jgi:inhibitor of cysteine peptidase